MIRLNRHAFGRAHIRKAVALRKPGIKESDLVAVVVECHGHSVPPEGLGLACPAKVTLSVPAHHHPQPGCGPRTVQKFDLVEIA